ncbi:putative reverse transcriptase domain-containing protein [Tanacetum coccineum]
MPPRRFKKKSVKKIVERRVAKAIEKYEKTRADSNNTGGSGSTNTGGTVVPEMHGCSYKTFMNCKPHSFKGTEGVVGLKRWFEKIEQVFEICKCAEDDKVKFAMCTFEGRALTWWNGNVQTLGLANANQIPWSNVKAMMTTEYCPATEIEKMEQELWTLTLKGDDIEAYNNRFHELVLMCPELMPTESKKIGKYIRGFPEGIKGNMISSKPATLHEAINMARALVEQSVQGKAARISESNKRKWEDNQRNTNNNNHNYNNNHNNNQNRNRNNNYPQQQNRRQEPVRAYAAAPAGGKIYAGNLPKCNRCNLHHHGPCPQRCQKCQKMGHLEKDCRFGVQGAGNNFLQNVTCFGCGEKGHFKDKCPKAGNQQNDGAHRRAYVVIENPQQNPSVVTAYHRALIDCYEKIVRIPLPNGKILEVQCERPKKDLRSLACIKADEKNLNDIRFQAHRQIVRSPYQERISKKRTKNEAKMTKPDTEWKSMIKTKSRQSPSLKKSTKVNPDKSKVKPEAISEENSQGKKIVDVCQEAINVSEDSEPEPAKKRTASRRVVKKKVTISADDNIIPDPDVALELGKSISITKAEEEEAARQVHATHARMVTESKPEPAKKKTSSRSTRGVVIQDPPSAPKPKQATSKLKINGVQPLTPEEQRAVDIMLHLKKVILEWGSEQESEYSKEDQGNDEEVNWIDSDEDEEKKDDTDDDKSIDLEMTDDEETDDDVLQGKEQVNDDEDEEKLNAEVEDSGKCDAEISDVAKADAEKTEEAKDDSKKARTCAELPLTSSSLSISSGFSDQFLKLSSDTSLVGAIKDTTDAKISSLLDIKIQFDVLHIHKIQTSTINLEQESEKSASEILKIKKEQAEKQKMPKYTIKSTDKAALKEYDQESALYQTMHENKSFNRNPANHRLYHALMEALIEDENAIDNVDLNISTRLLEKKSRQS